VARSITDELYRDLEEYENIDNRLLNRLGGDIDRARLSQALHDLVRGLAESGYADDLKAFGPNALIVISLTAETVTGEYTEIVIRPKVPAAVNREMTAGMPARRFRPTVERAVRDLRRAVRDVRKSFTALFFSLVWVGVAIILVARD
jgi:hypothetical protein